MLQEREHFRIFQLGKREEVNALNKWNFHISGTVSGTALPSEVKAAQTRFIQDLQKCNLKPEFAEGTLDGKTTNVLAEAGIAAGA